MKTLLLSLLSYVALLSYSGYATTAPSPYTDHRGPVITNNGVSFRVWAPNATRVTLAGSFNGWNTNADPLAPDDSSSNYWSIFRANVGPGDEYKFVVNNSLWRSDPWARELSNNNNAIIREPRTQWVPFTRPAPDETIFYELHIGSFNGANPTFEGVAEKAGYLKSLGINAVKLMPPAQFGTTHSWGYNPVAIYAPAQQYGGYHAFADMVDTLHAHGIAVHVDVVYNHIEGAVLWKWDGTSRGSHVCAIDGATAEHGGIYYYDWDGERWYTPWGHNRPNFDAAAVTNYLADNLWFWLEEMNCDGIRWDATYYIRHVEHGWPNIPAGESFLRETNREADVRQPSALMIAEDMQNYASMTDKNNFAFDTQWDANYVHNIRNEMMKTSDGDRNMYTLRDIVRAIDNNRASARIKYVDSHDEAGNGKARLNHEIDPSGGGTSWFAKKRSTLAAGLTLTAPGIPMLFMGQEFLESGWFDMNPDPLDWDKVSTFDGIWRLYRDLIHLRRNTLGITAGLSGPHINVFYLHNDQNVMAYHRYNTGGADDDVVVIVNARNTTWTNFELGMPVAGTWHCVLNSDWRTYDDGYGHVGRQTVAAAAPGMHGLPARATFDIPPYSLLIYSRATPTPPQPAFSATPIQGPRGTTIRFYDDTTGIGTNWVWNLGDGTTHQGINPTHSYAYPGTYSVSLTVYGPGGNATFSRENYITIDDTDWIDGQNIPDDFADAETVTFQNTVTDWGQWNSLLALRARHAGDAIELGITGSIEAPPGNGIVLFFDMSPQRGVSQIPDTLAGAAWRIRNMHGLTFDSGFLPEYALCVSLEQNPTPLNAWVDLSDLVEDSNVYWGQMTGLNTAFGTVSNNGARVALYNQTAAGSSLSVTGTFANGLELRIPFEHLGGQVEGCFVQAILISQDGTWSANQSLPPINNATGPHAVSGLTSNKNYSLVPGKQHILVGVPEPSTPFVVILGAYMMVRRKTRPRIFSHSRQIHV